MKRILVTGGAGFIGSNFIRYFLENCSCEVLVNLDALTYAGNLENLTDQEGDPRYQFVRGNIQDAGMLDKLFVEQDFDTVINFAAESHVDRSITDPACFLKTNVLGTQALLEVSRRHWSLAPDDKYCRNYQPGVRFLQISTDEVYGALSASGSFTEQTPLSPNSPYSASKASADLMVRAYHETFGLPVNITRCSNNYGPFQFPEKLIPLMIRNCAENIPLPVYGDGLQVRDWLHVSDHCSAVLAVLEKGIPGEIYNIGGNQEKTNLEIIKFILQAMGRDERLICHVRDRPGHDRRYAIDHTKITSQLGWRPVHTFEQGMRDTIEWYMTNRTWMQHITSGTYTKYYQEMYGMDAAH